MNKEQLKLNLSITMLLREITHNIIDLNERLKKLEKLKKQEEILKE